MKRERAKEILTDVLRTINSEQQELNVSTEDFTEAMLLAIEIL